MTDSNKQLAVIPILSPETVRTYVRRVISVPDLSQEEETELFRQFQEYGDHEAAKKLIISNRHFLQGFSMIVPSPWQVGHGCVIEKKLLP